MRSVHSNCTSAHQRNITDDAAKTDAGSKRHAQQVDRQRTASCSLHSQQLLQQAQVLTAGMQPTAAAEMASDCPQSAAGSTGSPVPPLDAASTPAAAAPSAEASTAAAGHAAQPTAAAGASGPVHEANSSQAQTDMSIVKALVQCSGTGCEDILEMRETAKPARRVRRRDSWVSRSFRGAAHSSCTLQLLHRSQSSVSIKVWLSCFWMCLLLLAIRFIASTGKKTYGMLTLLTVWLDCLHVALMCLYLAARFRVTSYTTYILYVDLISYRYLTDLCTQALLNLCCFAILQSVTHGINGLCRLR